MVVWNLSKSPKCMQSGEFMCKSEKNEKEICRRIDMGRTSFSLENTNDDRKIDIHAQLGLIKSYGCSIWLFGIDT